MARFHVEGANADASDLGVWDQIEVEFSDAPHERRAARALYRFTAGVPSMYDTLKRQGAVDMYLTMPDGEIAVVEVSSTHDTLLERDMHNSERLESDIAAAYTGSWYWVLHFHQGWEVPAIKARRQLATTIARELLDREHEHEHGYLAAVDWVFAWRDDSVAVPGVVIRGWDSRVPHNAHRSISNSFAEFLDGALMRSKRSKLAAHAQTLNANRRILYLATTPTGVNAHLAARDTWDLADGSFTLPSDIDELWLDSNGMFLRRYVAAQQHWVVYRVF